MLFEVALGIPLSLRRPLRHSALAASTTGVSANSLLTLAFRPGPASAQLMLSCHYLLSLWLWAEEPLARINDVMSAVNGCCRRGQVGAGRRRELVSPL